MAISQKNAGTWAASNATTQTVTLPAHAAGDMLIVRAGCKPYTGSPSISTSGWQAVNTAYANGTSGNGNGTGSVIVRAFWKVATSSSETNPVVDWGTTSAPGAAVAIVYQKGAGESWSTPVGDGGGDDTARTSQTATIQSHISVTAGDMVDFFVFTRDDSATTVPTITQTGVTFGTVAEYPATALASATSNDCAADGGYRLASSGTSSAAAVVTHTNAATESGAAWQTRLRVFTPTFTPSLASYRFYTDGTESGSTGQGTQDSALSLSIDANVNRALRVRIQETGGAAGVGTDDYQLQFRVNGGSWTNTGSGAITNHASSNLTDGGATTNRLGSGTGSFVAGEVSEDGLVDDHQLTASNYTEHLYALTFVNASLNDADVIEFQVLRNGAAITSAVTPTVNIVKQPVFGQPEYRFYEDGTESGSTAIAGQNVAISRNVDNNSQLHLRIRIQTQNNNPGLSTDDWRLRYSYNGGAYENCNVGKAVEGYDSANLTQSASTTNRLGAGAGTFVAGQVEEQPACIANNVLIGSGEYTDFLFAIQVNASQVNDGDTLEFILLRNGSEINSYSSVPKITVDKSLNVFWTEDFEAGGSGDAMSTSNTAWELFNGAGTRTIETSPTPVVGTKVGRYTSAGAPAVTKDTGSLPGTTNGGLVYKKLFFRGYVRGTVASGANRTIVFEESVANGGSDIAVARQHPEDGGDNTGHFRLGDGTTFDTTGTTHGISNTEWTRVEYMVDQVANEQILRLWWGADVHSASTGATNFDEISYVLTNNDDIEVWGLGNYNSITQTQNWDALALATGDWIGPIASANPVNVTDTGTVSSSESVTVQAGLAVTESGSLSSSETVTITAGLPRTDTSAITGTDTAAILATVSATDSSAITGSDIAAVAVTLTATDSSAIIGTDAAAVMVPRAPSDSSAITGADTASVAVFIAVTDTGAVTGTDSAQITASRTITDSSAVVGTDSAVVAVTITASDTSAVTGTDSASVAITAQNISVTDAGNITGTDAATIQAQLAISDSSALTGTDASSVQAGLPRTDTSAVTGTDAATVAASMAISDTGSITGTDSATVAVTSTASDTGTISGADSASVLVILSVADSTTLGSTETTAFGTIPITASDSNAITGSDTSSILALLSVSDSSAITASDIAAVQAGATASDTGTVQSTDAASLIMGTAVTDTGNLSGSDSSAITAARNITDSGAVTGTDAASVQAQNSPTDTGTVGSSETAVVNVFISTSDTGQINSSGTTAFGTIEIVASDTGAVSGSDSSFPFVDLPGQDSGVIVGTDSASIEIGGGIDVSVNDTGSISGGDAATISVALSVADTGALSGDDLAVRQTDSTTDAGAIVGNDSASIFVPISVSDIGAISGTDSSDIVTGGQIEKSASDSGAISGSDAATLAITQYNPTTDTTNITGTDISSVVRNQYDNPTDTGQITGDDQASLLVRISVGDTGQINSSEQTSFGTLSQPVTDTGQINSTDTASVVVKIDLADGSTIVGTDAASYEVQGVISKSGSDTGAISGDDQADVQKFDFVEINASDSGHIDAYEAIGLTTQITGEISSETDVDKVDVVTDTSTTTGISTSSGIDRSVETEISTGGGISTG